MKTDRSTNESLEEVQANLTAEQQQELLEKYDTESNHVRLVVFKAKQFLLFY